MQTTTQAVTPIVMIKNLGYVAIFFASSAYLGVNAETVMILSGLILMDVLTGVIKSFVVYGGPSLKSSRLASGVLAKLLLVLVPITLALAGKGVGMDVGALAQASISVLCLSESYSIIGNIHSIQTGQEKVEFDAIAFILRGLRSVLERYTVDDPKK